MNKLPAFSLILVLFSNISFASMKHDQAMAAREMCISNGSIRFDDLVSDASVVAETVYRSCQKECVDNFGMPNEYRNELKQICVQAAVDNILYSRSTIRNGGHMEVIGAWVFEKSTKDGVVTHNIHTISTNTDRVRLDVSCKVGENVSESERRVVSLLSTKKALFDTRQKTQKATFYSVPYKKGDFKREASFIMFHEKYVAEPLIAFFEISVLGVKNKAIIEIGGREFEFLTTGFEQAIKKVDKDCPLPIPPSVQ